MSRSWLLIPAAATELIAIRSVFKPRAQANTGALVGALGAQVMLRWPEMVFHGFPSLVAAALVVVCAPSAWRNSSRLLRRRSLQVVIGLVAAAFILSVPLLVATLLVRGEVSKGQQAAKVALEDVGGGGSAIVSAELQLANENASRASSAVGGWWTAGARLLPVVAQQGRFVAVALKTAAQISSVGERQVSAIDYHNLEYHDGRVNLARLRAMATPTRIVNRQLHLAVHQLDAVGSGWLLAPIQSRASIFDNELTRSAHSADLAMQAVRVLPGLLGGDGPRNYLLAFMSPSESRGYDGFIGAYGVLTAVDGHVSLTQSGPTTDIEANLPPSGATLTGVPGFLARYGIFDPGKFARDATYSPGFPTDADVFTQIFEQAGGVPIDGVLGLDPYGLAAFLHFTGPIQVPGLPVLLTESNAAEVLLKTQYTTFDVGIPNQDQIRHDFLQQTLHLTFNKLVSGSLPSPKELSAALDPDVVRGRISFWSFHADEQPLLRQLGVDGSFPRTQGKDLLAVTTQNSGNNKIDAFLHKSIDDRITFDPGSGSVSSTVTITLVNDAPASGLPSIVIDNPGDPGTPAGTNVTWLTVYSPLLFDRLTVNGVRGSMTVGKELGVNAYSQFIDIPAKSTVTLKVHLIGHIGPGPYRLEVRLQPSANSQHGRVEVTPSTGWRLATNAPSAHWTLGSGMRQTRSFQFVAG